MRSGLMACLAAAVVLPACDEMRGLQRGTAAGERDDSQVAVAVEVPDLLDWGEAAAIRMTVTNEGSTPSRELRMELFLPPWLEFTGVDPVGTEVALLSGGDETRLSYTIADPPLGPGEAHTFVQRVRVQPRATLTATGNDVGVASPLVPRDRTLRVRLVAPDGHVLGTELRVTLPFRGAGSAPPPPPRAIPDPPSEDTARALRADTLPRDTTTE